MSNHPRPRGTDEARLITVIETKALAGAGTTEDPCRKVIQYWDLKGNLLSINDPYLEAIPSHQQSV